MRKINDILRLKTSGLSGYFSIFKTSIFHELV
jgi:hypothetical protein